MGRLTRICYIVALVAVVASGAVPLVFTISTTITNSMGYTGTSIMTYPSWGTVLVGVIYLLVLLEITAAVKEWNEKHPPPPAG